MKKLIGLLVALPLLLGLTVVTNFPVTVAWDAGVGAAGYEVVVARTDHTGIMVVGTTAALEYTIQTVEIGTDWVVGVRSVNGTLYSDYIWSDSASDPFVLRRLPGAPGNLRIK